MTEFRRMVFEVKSLLHKITEFSKTGFVSTIQTLNEKIKMTGRKIENDDEYIKNLPNKKICTEEEKKNTSDLNANANDLEKIKKRNVALLLAYCGTNYWGMQRNPNCKTVESELLNALSKANFIPSKAVEEIQQIHFQRAARTDKGVSAAKQVVSFKIAHNFNTESINSYLPEDIKVLSIKRVTKGFNCKNECTARTYSYTLPSFALAPDFHEEYPKNFKITDAMIQKTNEVLNSFLGTRNYHNFTSKKNSKDPSAKRYIMSFKTEKPFTDGEEFITLTVKGQSFMLHQIRKMVGYTIAVLKGLAPSNVVNDLWKEQKFSIPMAPGLGLVLENLHYDRYNRKFGNDGLHEALTWDEIADQVEIFKRKYILSNIIRKENEEKLMYNWIQTLPYHRYEYSIEEDIMETKNEEIVN